MNALFKGKAGIVTGASSGIGRTIAQTLGEAGMELWLVGRSEEQLELTAASIKNLGGADTHCVVMNLSEAGALAGLVAEVANQHPYLFTVINNAGVMYPEPVISADPQRWHEMFAINLLTPMESCRAAVIEMRKHGQPGYLINISSIAGKEDSFGAYGVSKAALNHLGKTLRKELEFDDIRVTTIIPGGFASNLLRGFTPETLAGIQQKMEKSGMDPESAEAKKLVADPQHIADIISHIIQQPIDLNFEELTIRPAINASL